MLRRVVHTEAVLVVLLAAIFRSALGALLRLRSYFNQTGFIRRLALNSVIVSLLFAVTSPEASAVMIDFNSVSPASAQSFYEEHGFALVSPDGGHFHLNYANGSQGGAVVSQNGSTALWLHDHDLTLTKADSSLFSFEMFDAAELYSSDPSNVNGQDANARFIEVRGLLMGGGVVSATFALDGFADGDPGLPADFQTFVLPSTFHNLQSVQFFGTGSVTGERNFFAIDNLAVSAVPEAWSFFLLGLGLASVIAIKFRESR